MNLAAAVWFTSALMISFTMWLSAYLRAREAEKKAKLWMERYEKTTDELITAGRTVRVLLKTIPPEQIPLQLLINLTSVAGGGTVNIDYYRRDECIDLRIPPGVHISLNTKVPDA